jgi:hypothetical protein
MTDINPLDRCNSTDEHLIGEYRKRFGDEPPSMLLQGPALIEAVKEALKTNRPILFDVPDDGFA